MLESQPPSVLFSPKGMNGVPAHTRCQLCRSADHASSVTNRPQVVFGPSLKVTNDSQTLDFGGFQTMYEFSCRGCLPPASLALRCRTSTARDHFTKSGEVVMAASRNCPADEKRSMRVIPTKPPAATSYSSWLDASPAALTCAAMLRFGAQ